MVDTHFFCPLDNGLSVKGLNNIRAGTKSPGRNLFPCAE
jgi:hypothetical protein